MQSPGERLWESYLFSSKSHGLAVSVRLDAADVMGRGSAQNLHEMFQGALQGTNTGFVRAPPPQGSSVHPTKLLLARMALQTQVSEHCYRTARAKNPLRGCFCQTADGKFRKFPKLQQKPE